MLKTIFAVGDACSEHDHGKPVGLYCVSQQLRTCADTDAGLNSTRRGARWRRRIGRILHHPCQRGYHNSVGVAG